VTTISRTISYAVVSSSLDAKGDDFGSITFGYDDADPLAVTLYFGIDPRRGPLERWFARDLLADGLTAELAGSHEVACWTRDGWFHIGLSGGDGNAVFKLAADEVRAFLVDAEDLVPYGSEAIDFDAELDALLKDGAR
jgi:hypothetical protein